MNTISKVEDCPINLDSLDGLNLSGDQKKEIMSQIEDSPKEKKYTPQEEERGKDYLWKYLNEGDKSLLIFHMKKEETGADTMKLKETSIGYQYH